MSEVPLLVNADEALALVGATNPPRLFAGPYLGPNRAPPELRPLADEDAGGLVGGSPAWTCPNVLAAVGYLIDCWCERRCLGPLARILAAWPTNGLTDGAHDLLDALRGARTVARGQATDFECELLTAAESALAQELAAP
jgi:hypothetical protein